MPKVSWLRITGVEYGTKFCGFGKLRLANKNDSPYYMAMTITTHGRTSGAGNIVQYGKTIPFTVQASSTYANSTYYYCTYPCAYPANANQYQQFWATAAQGAAALGSWWEIRFDSPITITAIGVDAGLYVPGDDPWKFSVTSDKGELVPQLIRGQMAQIVDKLSVAVLALKNGVYYARQGEEA